MKAKSVITILLLAFVGLSIAYLALKDPEETAVSDAETTDAVAAGQIDENMDHQVVAYYFHGHKRCPSCLKIEAYSKEAVETGFGDAIESGSLVWKVINYEEPGFEHYADDYKLVTQSLVIVDLRNGEQMEWKNLNRVWELLIDKDEFTAYVRDEINTYLSDS
jgi:hypothetical protein